MEVLLSEDWKPMVDELVHAGRYGSANEVVDEGMRLVQQREAKLAALRETIEASIARGGSYTSEEVLANAKAAIRKAAAGKPKRSAVTNSAVT